MSVCVCVCPGRRLCCVKCLLAPEHLSDKMGANPHQECVFAVFPLLSRREHKHMAQTARALWPSLHLHESRHISPKSRNPGLGIVFGNYPDKHTHLLFFCVLQIQK